MKVEDRKRRSHRRTLLCCSTLCLLIFLIILLFINEIYYSHSIQIKNKTKSLNVINFRLSLINCGESVVKRVNLYEIIEEINEIIQNRENIFVKEEIINWLEFILNSCSEARQYSIIEQEKPTIIRKIISSLRKEFLYLIGFFIKKS
jgi:hypothetical protein